MWVSHLLLLSLAGGDFTGSTGSFPLLFHTSLEPSRPVRRGCGLLDSRVELGAGAQGLQKSWGSVTGGVRVQGAGM